MKKFRQLSEEVTPSSKPEAGREAVELAASELRSAWDDLSKSLGR